MGLIRVVLAQFMADMLLGTVLAALGLSVLEIFGCQVVFNFLTLNWFSKMFGPLNG